MSSFPVAGVRVGHRTGAATGVTVMLLPAGSVASAELRGGAPATRELDVLDPVRTVARADAVVFSGGSAFGLATASGVMRYFAERGQGFPTAGGPVPIVPTACIFDLVETSGPRPGETDGYEACVAAARDEPLAIGRVGAGAGATVGKWQGRDHAVDGGLGVASKEIDGVTVAALAVVNAAGDVVAADGSVIAGSTAPPGTAAFEHPDPFEEDRGNTTLAVVVTDALLDKASCFVLAQAAHDGFARALRPAHTRFDGDVAIAVATGSRPVDPSANVDRIALVAADVVAGAIRAACAGGNSRSSG